jgi:molybdenum-dependent DNA-binding transcriptional regulator ModE
MARFPATLGEASPAMAGAALLAELEAAMDAGELDEIPFDPVPRLRQRRGGWSAERQRLFIALLRLCGSVSAAAKAVGMTPRSVYRLLKHEGAESFAEAWNVAFEEGLERTRASALERALTGALVPVYRRGKLVRVEHRYSDKLALGLLSGKDTNIDWYQQGAVRRYKYNMELKAAAERDAEEKRLKEQRAREYQESLERMLAKAAAIRPVPRCRVL